MSCRLLLRWPSGAARSSSTLIKPPYPLPSRSPDYALAPTMRRNSCVNPSPSLASEGKTTADVGIHGTLRRPKRGMTRWRCGSEDDQHEDLKPQHGGDDRHEP